MSDRKSNPSHVPQDWDTYWHGAGERDAFVGGGSAHPAILGFWDSLFGNIASARERVRIVDIAGGNGAVLERASRVLAGSAAQLTCIDVSESAVRMVEQRISGVRGIVADARDVPLDDSSFDIVTSQFGIEYAGLDAIGEMLRLVDDGGQLALLLHHRGGGIYRQCRASLDALTALEESGFVKLAIETFDTGFAAARGGDRSPYEAAAQQFVPAIRAVESIMRRYGTEVADGTIVALYKDIGAMHGRLPHYDPDEVLAWLGRMQDELRAYAGRMSSMCAAAIDADVFNDLCLRIENTGFAFTRRDELIADDRGVSLAWAIIADKV